MDLPSKLELSKMKVVELKDMLRKSGLKVSGKKADLIDRLDKSRAPKENIRSLSGIRDVDLKILEELNDRDLLSFCLTNKYGKSLCDNEPFWRRRFVKRFGEHEKTPDRTWKDFYLKLLYYSKYDQLPIEKARYNRLREVVKGGYKNIDLIKYFISNDRYIDMDLGMITATKIGDKKLIDFFISQGANNWDGGLYNAALFGNKDLVIFFISKGATSFDWPLRAAQHIGDQELIDFFKAKMRE